MALRALRRDWQSGELRVLAIALLIAVASVAAVGFFTDRIQQAMERKASELLGADLVVVRVQSRFNRYWRMRRADRVCELAETLNFRSVVVSGDLTQLAEVKAVGPGYPLRGALQISDRRLIPDAPSTVHPRVRVRSGWMSGCCRALGSSESAMHGSTRRREFRIGAVLAYEPDRAGDLFSIAPRLLMNVADMPVDSTDPTRQPGRIPPVVGRRAGGAGGVSRLGRQSRLKPVKNCKACAMRVPNCGRRWSGRSDF
jgi:putative ABC transport system permease protein